MSSKMLWQVQVSFANKNGDKRFYQAVTEARFAAEAVQSVVSKIDTTGFYVVDSILRIQEDK